MLHTASQFQETYFSEGQRWAIVLAAGEGTRVRDFLTQLCGGRGIKQFSAVIGNQTMLGHTLARILTIIPRHRIVIIVSEDHRAEVAQQLADWPTENIIFQPTNRDTAAGVLLPLAYVTHRDPFATVAVFPSDHFILDEHQFMDCVQRAMWETQWFPWAVTLLGVTPDKVEDGYGWIEPEAVDGRFTCGVRRFWEKPSLSQASTLWQQGALWNTFVCVANAGALWRLVCDVVPDLYGNFLKVRQAIGTSDEDTIVRQVYRQLRAVNFSSDVCQHQPHRLRVFPVPQVGWSDWGSVERIVSTFEQLGKTSELLARLNQNQYVFPPGQDAVYSLPVSTINVV
jgi:mannose-1-phosphate guanylyltransferase